MSFNSSLGFLTVILDFTEKIFSQFFCLFVMDFRPGSGSLTMTDQLHLLWKIRLMNFGLLKLGLEWRRNFLDVVSSKASKVIALYLPLIKLEDWRIYQTITPITSLIWTDVIWTFQFLLCEKSEILKNFEMKSHSVRSPWRLAWKC